MLFTQIRLDGWWTSTQPAAAQLVPNEGLQVQKPNVVELPRVQGGHRK